LAIRGGQVGPDAVAHPREGRGVVEVGHRDVRVAGHDHGLVGLHRLEEVDHAGRVRAVEDEVAGNRDEVRPGGVDRLANGLERREVAVDVGDHRQAGHRSTPSPGMMKLSVVSQATSPSTLATARPRPNRPPSFSIVTSRRRVSPGTTIA
jgi:hypothetical protein